MPHSAVTRDAGLSFVEPLIVYILLYAWNVQMHSLSITLRRWLYML